MITLAAFIADAFLELFRPAERRALYPSIALVSLVVYASSLGYLPDVYRFGFLPVGIAIAAFIGIIVAEWSLSIGVLLLCVFAAFDLRLLNSRNLIDYFVNPIAATIAAAWCAWRFWRWSAARLQRVRSESK